MVDFDVQAMSSAGRSKVRHVGGWAVRKVLENSREYSRKNINSGNVETLNSIERHHRVRELVEESLIASFAKLECEGQHKETLEMTEARQYRERGLLHIEDAVCTFFMYLERLRVQLINSHILRRERGMMVERAHETIPQNKDLRVL